METWITIAAVALALAFVVKKIAFPASGGSGGCSCCDAAGKICRRAAKSDSRGEM